MKAENTDTLEHDGSHLTIRDDLVEEGLSVPVHFLDYKEDVHVEHTDTLNIDCIFISEGVHRDEFNDPSELDILLKKYENLSVKIITFEKFKEFLK